MQSKIKSFGHNMLIKENQLKDVFEINSIPKTDNRGSFSRFFCKKTLSELSKNINIVQINSSYSKTAGTVRGLHFQSFPSQESKFVRCIKGKIFDVIVDIRKESKTFGKWQSIILDSKTQNMVFIPSGYAHGFQTLLPDCEILYLHTDYHEPELECGFHYNSKDLKINWPLDVTQISDRDKKLEIFQNKRKDIYYEV